MQNALVLLSKNSAENGERGVFTAGGGHLIGFMPAESGPAGLLGYKAVSVVDHKAANSSQATTDCRTNPHQGLVTLLEPATGRVKAILDSSTITALRTAAVSAAATDCLSRKESRILSLVGAGRQAFEHAIAMSQIRPLEQIKIYSRTIASAKVLRTELQNQLLKKLSRLVKVDFVSSVCEALEETDIIVACTSSRAPLFHIAEVRKGTHINLVGASRPGSKEIVLVDQKNLRLYMDSRQSCLSEASEIIDPTLSGELSSRCLLGEIGGCFSGTLIGRSSNDDVTVFKSVGLGIEDVFAAQFFVQRAESLGLGTQVNLHGDPFR